MQECKHKRKFKATIVDCCTEGNVLSNNIDKIYQIEPNLIPSRSAISCCSSSEPYGSSVKPTTLLKEYELANYFRIK